MGHDARMASIGFLGVGTISEAVVLPGFGHPLLRRSIEKIMGLLPGRSFGQPWSRAVEIPIEFEFELE